MSFSRLVSLVVKEYILLSDVYYNVASKKENSMVVVYSQHQSI